MRTEFDSKIVFGAHMDPVCTKVDSTYSLFRMDPCQTDHMIFPDQNMWCNSAVPMFTHSRTNSSSSTRSSFSSIGPFPPEYQEPAYYLTKTNTSAGTNVNIKNLLLYKTEFCRSFEEKGECRYGLKCQFAHGSHELRQVPKHPKYKTQLCRTFWESGACSYGKRCCFVHNENILPSDSVKPARGKHQSIFGASALTNSIQNKPFPW